MLYVETGYLSKEAYAALDWNALRSVWPKELPESKPTSIYTCCTEKIRVTYEEAYALVALGFSLTILPPIGMMTVKMSDRENWDHDVRPQDIVDAKAVQIAVPDMALMYIDEVEVQKDFCTDALQSMLDEGWRILAICPPNAARRPDYILGRRKPTDPFGRTL